MDSRRASSRGRVPTKASGPRVAIDDGLHFNFHTARTAATRRVTRRCMRRDGFTVTPLQRDVRRRAALRTPTQLVIANALNERKRRELGRLPTPPALAAARSSAVRDWVERVRRTAVASRDHMPFGVRAADLAAQTVYAVLATATQPAPAVDTGWSRMTARAADCAIRSTTATRSASGRGGRRDSTTSQVKAGDLPPQRSAVFSKALERAVEVWRKIDANHLPRRRRGSYDPAMLEVEPWYVQQTYRQVARSPTAIYASANGSAGENRTTPSSKRRAARRSSANLRSRSRRTC